MDRFIERLYRNIGRSIKKLAFWFFVFGAITGIVVGIVILQINNELTPIVFPIMIVSPFVFFFGSWFVYGFGQLIENTDVLREEREKALRKKKEIQVPEAQSSKVQTHAAVSARPVRKSGRDAAQQPSSSAEPDHSSVDHAVDAPQKKMIVGSEELQALLLKALALSTDEELVHFLDESLWAVSKKDKKIILDLMDRPQEDIRAGVKNYLAQLKQS